MKSPYTGKEMMLCKEERQFSFRKEDFVVVYHYFKCAESDESFTTTELDDLNLNQLYNQYRVRHNIPFPDEILKLKEFYGLSSAKMSEVLGFGPNSYRNYENGEVPNLSNSRLIQLAKDAREFKKLLQLSNAFKDKPLIKVLGRLDDIIREQKEHQPDLNVKQYFLGAPVADNFTGFRIPDIRRFTEMIIFFAGKVSPYKTKMNKLLFYADFLMYQKSGYSISGFRYKAIVMGPVPDKYEGLYDYLATNDEFDMEFKDLDGVGQGEKFKPNPEHPFSPQLFSESELVVLDEVAKRFKKSTTKEIVDISHKETGWLVNKDNNGYIDYKYGFHISFQDH